MKKRIFIAAKIPDQLLAKIMAWQEKNQKKFPVRWIKPDNLHITLLPPWYEENISQLGKKLHKIKGIKTIPIELTSICPGPNPKRPRLIWLEGKNNPQLSTLVDQLRKIFSHQPEQRDFRLHITLARLNNKDKNPLLPFKKQVVWQDTIQSIVLMESKLLRSGAQYQILYEVKLSNKLPY